MVFADRLVRRVRPGESVTGDPTYRNRAGAPSMLLAGALSIWLFSNQARHVGTVPSAIPAIGDLTFEVGFLLAFCPYAVLHRPLAGPIGRTAATPATVSDAPAG